MENGIKTQRQFLMLMAGGIVVFAAMLFVWGNAGVARAPVQGQAQVLAGTVAQNSGGVQEVYVKALSSGVYDKQQITVKKGIPVRFHFSAENGAGCGKVLVIKQFGVQLVSRSGEDSFAEFTPTQTGSFEYSCTMRMFRGTLVVVP